MRFPLCAVSAEVMPQGGSHMATGDYGGGSWLCHSHFQVSPHTMGLSAVFLPTMTIALDLPRAFHLTNILHQDPTPWLQLCTVDSSCDSLHRVASLAEVLLAISYASLILFLHFSTVSLRALFFSSISSPNIRSNRESLRPSIEQELR